MQAPLNKYDPARQAEQVNCPLIDAGLKLSIDPAVHLEGRASHSPLILSNTHPPDFPLGSQTPVFVSNATHTPCSNAFGALQSKHPPTSPLQHVSQSGLQAIQLDERESKNVRGGQVMKVPLAEAVVAVTHLVAEVERGWREGWQVRQVPVGPVQDAQDGSQARQSPEAVAKYPTAQAAH